MYEPDEIPPPGWSIEVSPDTTVLEVAALLGGIGQPARAFMNPGGGCTIRPTFPGWPHPTGEQLRDILEHGVGTLPLLMPVHIYKP